MTTQKYRQVEISRKFPGGKIEGQVCWLPSEFAVIGRKLEIRIDGIWTVGWIVEHVYAREINNPIYAAGEIKDHRRATGDSIRKVASRK